MPGDVPSDSVTRVIYPIGHGGPTRAFYYTAIPAKHMPGTHWMHPHRHGSTTLQVGGGASAAIIVEDLVPKEKRFWSSRFRPGREWERLKIANGVDGAKEILLIFQPIWDMKKISDVDYRGDPVYATNVDGDFTLVNGKINPIIVVKQYEWTRLRLINTAHTNLVFFNFFIDTCEMYLLSKDGIYIQDFPRRIKSAWPAPGGRADVMVRCLRSGTHNLHAYTDNDKENPTLKNVAARVRVIRNRRGRKHMKKLGKLRIPVDGYDAYLQRTINAPVEEACKCETTFEVLVNSSGPFFAVNNHVYHSHERIHHSVRGKMQQRLLNASIQGGHPYHQHVIPYQINRIDDLPGPSKPLRFPGGPYDQFFKVGDWHDTFAFDGILRFNPSNHTGKMILHCHKLDHEDEGMMSTEEILPEGEQCHCGWKTSMSLVMTQYCTTSCRK